MRHRWGKGAVLGMVLIPFLTGTAAAKGPMEADITWEGAATPVHVGQEDLGSGDRWLGELTGVMGVYSEMDVGLLDAAPADELGPAVTITWTMPGPTAAADTIAQTVYPYAEGGPLVHTEPGQRFFGTERTDGGWFRAPLDLTAVLRELGVPSRDAIDPEPDGRSVPWVMIGATLSGIVLAATVAARIAARRRRIPAAVAT